MKLAFAVRVSSSVRTGIPVRRTVLTCDLSCDLNIHPAQFGESRGKSEACILGG